MQPWDDGSLKIAVEAALGLRADETAVSNAVLWSRVEGNRNLTPSQEMIDRSIEVWRAMMPVLAPKHVVTVGVVARTVVEALGASPWVHTALRHPSPNAMSRMSGMFDADDLLVRYPEVKRVAAEHPGWFETYSQNKVFFACHAASLLRHHVRPAT